MGDLCQPRRATSFVIRSYQMVAARRGDFSGRAANRNLPRACKSPRALTITKQNRDQPCFETPTQWGPGRPRLRCGGPPPAAAYSGDATNAASRKQLAAAVARADRQGLLVAHVVIYDPFPPERRHGVHVQR